jgi:hypothetical protein
VPPNIILTGGGRVRSAVLAEDEDHGVIVEYRGRGLAARRR